MVELGWWGVPIGVVGGAIRVSTPFLFVSLGECITERSGRINLGLEGILVMGAMSGYAVSYTSGNPWLGVLAAGGEDAVDERLRAAPVGVALVGGDAVATRGGEVEALVEQVSSGEPGAHEIPGQPEQGRPCLRVHAIGAVEELDDPELRTRMGRANRDKAREFAPDVVGRAYLAVLRKVVDARAPDREPACVA